ncbi:uncharacterized protein J3R85_018930 [Psidium guajava]|nr:uncharacterized protein J3R85_018930 [Psidium guajava]
MLENSQEGLISSSSCSDSSQRTVPLNVTSVDFSSSSFPLPFCWAPPNFSPLKGENSRKRQRKKLMTDRLWGKAVAGSVLLLLLLGLVTDRIAEHMLLSSGRRDGPSSVQGHHGMFFACEALMPVEDKGMVLAVFNLCSIRVRSTV